MIVAGVIASSCNMDELFEREQYKKVFSLLSDNEENVFAEEHDLTLEYSQGNISAICGGSLPTENDIQIAIIEDDEVLADYNTRMYGNETDKYASRLPQSNYDIEKYNITIPAGERKGLMPINIHRNESLPDYDYGLSPDSVYLLPLSMAGFSAYEVNPEKRTLLYRVYLKNRYATNKTETTYIAQGKVDVPEAAYAMQDENFKDIYMTGPIIVTALTGNSVRIMAGHLPRPSDDDALALRLKAFDEGAIRVAVDEDNNVTVTSWGSLPVVQITKDFPNDGDPSITYYLEYLGVTYDPEYSNTFYIEKDDFATYKTFRFQYAFQHLDTDLDPDPLWYVVREELRLEFDEDKDDYF